MWLEHQTHFNEHFYSDFFTISELQVLVASPTASPVGITISASYLASLVSVRSVTLSMPYVTSKEHSYAQLDNGQHSMVPSNVYVYKNFPCAIYFLPQTLIKTGILLQMEVRKKTITKEQLIGIVCGSAAGFFLILALIVFIIQRKNRTIDYYDEIDFFSSESGNVSGEETHQTEEIIKKVFVPRPFSI